LAALPRDQAGDRMSLRVPLAVRIKTSRTDRHVTGQIRDLRFRSQVPGGFASIEMSFDRPLVLQPDEVEYYARCYVYDSRNGQVVCEGRLEDPGRGAGASGQVWRLTTMGPSAHATDRTVPLIYIDDPMMSDSFIRADNQTPGGRDSRGGDPGTTTGVQNALILQWPEGLTIAINARVVMRYVQLMETGQKLARVDYRWDAGVTDTNANVECVVRTDGSTASGDVVRSDNFNVAGGGLSAREIGTDWAAGRNTAEWRILKDAGATAAVGTDTYWASFRDMLIQATRYDKAGTELLTGASYNSTVNADEIVADLLGRLLTAYDGANAVIDTTATHPIGQLAYHDGVTAATVLDDLMRLEPDFYWAAWESSAAAGKHRFVWRTWPTTVRYEANIVDGFDSPGSAGELFNEVSVRWRDQYGLHTTTRTQTVPALTAAGLTRTALVDLGDELASSVDAQRAGDEFLAQHLNPPNAGRLSIARPILDRNTGRMIAPFEIRPGELVRVRGVLPQIDSLNATTRDGITVFRIVAVEYDSATNTATLDLDSTPRTTAHTLAAVSASPALTRRRR
jgi:hypothetical protein